MIEWHATQAIPSQQNFTAPVYDTWAGRSKPTILVMSEALSSETEDRDPGAPVPTESAAKGLPASGSNEAAVSDRRPRSIWNYMEKLLPLVALLLSISSLVTSYRASIDVARLDALKTQYSAFTDLAKTQLQFPLMSHLFSVSNQAYDSDVLRIRAAIRGSSSRELAMYLAQERATAHYIFVAYEQTYYMWKQSADSGDEKKKTQLGDDLYYFDTAFSNNPRMSWFWDQARGGKLSLAFAPELRDYFQENVSQNRRIDLDPLGPFAGAGADTNSNSKEAKP